MHGAVQLPQGDFFVRRGDLRPFGDDVVFYPEGVPDSELVNGRDFFHAHRFSRDRSVSGDDLPAVRKEFDRDHLFSGSRLRMSRADEVGTALGTAGHAVVGPGIVDADQSAFPLDAVDVPSFAAVETDFDVLRLHDDGVGKLRKKRPAQAHDR